MNPRAPNRSGRIAAIAVACALLAAAAFAYVTRYTETRSSLYDPAALAAQPAAVRGAILFAADDWGGLNSEALETHAVPWRLTAAALVLATAEADPRATIDHATLRRILTGFGFLFPTRIGNWPAGQPPFRSGLPLGIIPGDLSRMPGMTVQVANLGCASCHAGVTYDAAGAPDLRTAWLGAPNSALDLEAYTVAIYRAYRATADRPDALIAAVATLYPDTTRIQELALRHAILPRVRARMAALESLGRPTPFPNGSPGNTNGVAALKQALAVPLAGRGAGEQGFTSIPDLGSRTWRTSLLWDGAYAVPGCPRNAATTRRDLTGAHRASLAAITTFFTVPSMGVHPDRAVNRLPAARDVMAFLDGYRPPPFPGPVDSAATNAGRTIYAARCASCHGSYDASADRPRLVSFPNWIGDVGTDRVRADAFDAGLVKAVSATRYARTIAPARTGRYAAPPLTGLWASAPYLHNGSIPTVDALLRPETRPGKFLVGGHRLDLTRLGIDLAADGTFPPGYTPWSTPAMRDTRAPGMSNVGHSAQNADLTDTQRTALIQYLKRL